MKKTVLLTGVTGFLGSHTTIKLLEKGYRVIGTLRDMDRAQAIRSVIEKHTQNIDSLDFAEAHLEDESVWDKLIQRVDFVQHIASPFPRELPKHENDLILPAKAGTLNIVKAAARNGVKRVVITSSVGAIVYGKPKHQRNGTFTEADWTDVANKQDSTPYFRSKTLAEKAAWEFIKKDPSGLELSVVCPGAILGPVLEKDFGTSANLVIKTMDGSSPALPDLGFDIVDVRSVADLLILAMEKPGAAGERFIATAGYMKFKEIAQVVKSAYPGKKIPTGSLPNFVVKLYSNIDKTLKPVLIDLGVSRKTGSSKAKDVLHWEPLSNREAVLSCAQSVIDLKLV